MMAPDTAINRKTLAAAFPAADFAAALLDPGCTLPAGLKAWNGSDPLARMDVYRNNVVHSLVDALATTFDVVRQLIGDESFRATASVFVRRHPPQSPILTEYGETLPLFLAGFPPLTGLPFLCDVARLEFARVQAFHAADASALDPALLAPFWADPAALARVKLTAHPSLRVLRSDAAMSSIWSAHQGMGALGELDITRPEAALVLRENDDAAVFQISHASAHFVELVMQGQTLGECAQQTLASRFPDGVAFDLAGTLGLLLHHPALCGQPDDGLTCESTS